MTAPLTAPLTAPPAFGSSTAAPPALRLAVAQPLMRWTGQANTQDIVQALGQAAAAGAQLCLFPELALTGFHREIAREAQPALVAAQLQQVQAACAQHGLAAALGAPTFDDEGLAYNSHLLVDAAGRLAATWAKRGLTAPEATFFARGNTRPVVALCGRQRGDFACRPDHADAAAGASGPGGV